MRIKTKPHHSVSSPCCSSHSNLMKLCRIHTKKHHKFLHCSYFTRKGTHSVYTKTKGASTFICGQNILRYKIKGTWHTFQFSAEEGCSLLFTFITDKYTEVINRTGIAEASRSYSNGFPVPILILQNCYQGLNDLI